MNALTIKFPDSLYETLLRRAAMEKQPPDQFALKLIENAIKPDRPDDEDPLLRLAGIFESPHRDIAEKHDDYIGRQIMTDNG
jgi:hypothetical protein